MSPRRILVATDLTSESVALLEAADDVDVLIVPPKTSNVRAALGDASAIITRSDFKLDAPLLEHAPQLKLIARMSAGLTGIDVDYATERGILVMNIPGCQRHCRCRTYPHVDVGAQSQSARNP